MERDLFATFKPDGDALLRRISMHVDDPTLEHIAKLDPTGRSVAKLLRELRKIRGHGIIDRPLKWEPREVLEFTGSIEPEAAGKTNPWEFRGTPGHWARAFACATLMRAYGDAETRQIVHSGYNAALIQLLESLRHLDAGLEPEAMAALAWFIMRLRASDEVGVEDEIAFAGVGLLSLAVKSRSTVQGSVIVELAQWLLAQEQRALGETSEAIRDFPRHWLFRTTHFMLHDKWIALGAELAAYEGTGQCGDAVRAIGQRLAGKKLEE